MTNQINFPQDISHLSQRTISGGVILWFTKEDQTFIASVKLGKTHIWNLIEDSLLTTQMGDVGI